jgi:ABC-2 type transport system permease protein
MRLYVEVARRTYARIAAYRSATVAGVFTNTVFGFLLAYVLLAVYEDRASVGGFSATDSLTFTFVAQGLLMPLGLFGSTEIADRITTGDVIVDLQRPYDHQAWWAAVDYGKAAYYLVFRGIPPFVAGALVFHLDVPGALQAAAFLASVAFAIGVAFAWRYLLQLSAFWLLDVRGPNQLGWLVAQFLGGTFVPIVFFPGGLGRRPRAGRAGGAGAGGAPGGGARWLRRWWPSASGADSSGPGSGPTGSTARRSSCSSSARPSSPALTWR